MSPRLGFALVVGFAAALGLPGLVGFWGEFLAVLRRVVARRPTARWAVPHSARCSRCSAPCSPRRTRLRVLRTVWAGERTEPRLVDARGGELAVLAVLVLAVVALGVAPGPLLQTTIADATAITEPAGSVSR